MTDLEAAIRNAMYAHDNDLDEVPGYSGSDDVRVPSEVIPLERSRHGRWVAPIAASLTLIAVTLVVVLITQTTQTRKPGQAAVPVASPSMTTLPSGALSGSPDPLSPSSAQPNAEPLLRLTTAEAASMASVPWRLAGIGTDGTVITVTYASGSCERFGYEMDETDTDVRIRVAVAPVAPPAGMVCATYLRQAAGTITLSRPLGDRRLLHAATAR